MIESYSAAVQALYARINYEQLGTEQYSSQDLKLERMRRLLAALGHPQLKIPAVHVAGTKGKGTTCALVSQMLQQAGYRVGLFTSPHLYRIEERLTVNGAAPAPETFVRLVSQTLDVVAEIDRTDPAWSPTFFEVVNALAWQHFVEQQVEVVVLEVGLGGRLDSTNLCAPLVTAITSISFDHMRILGNTLSLIAAEKAGILKGDVPAICGVTEPESKAVIHARALHVGAPLRQLGIDFSVEVLKPWSLEEPFQQMRIQTSGKSLELQMKQPGPVYAQNAAIAVACVQELGRHGFQISEAAIQQAAWEVEMLLRYEMLTEAPRLIVDSAHNPASVRALLTTTRQLFPGQPLTVMLAVSRDKDYAAICRELTGVETVIATTYEGNERALSAARLLSTLQTEYSGQLFTAATPAEAWELAKQIALESGVVLATGSLFFAAEVRALVKAAQADKSLPTADLQPVIS